MRSGCIQCPGPLDLGTTLLPSMQEKGPGRGLRLGTGARLATGKTFSAFLPYVCLFQVCPLPGMPPLRKETSSVIEEEKIFHVASPLFLPAFSVSLWNLF